MAPYDPEKDEDADKEGVKTENFESVKTKMHVLPPYSRA